MLLDEVRTRQNCGNGPRQPTAWHPYTHQTMIVVKPILKDEWKSQEMVFFSFHFPSAFFLLGVSVLINIHKIWWFPKSDFKHFETPVFPLCIYRINAETNFDISFLFCENATFFFPGLSSWVERNEAQQIKNYSTQISKAVKLVSTQVGGRSKDQWGGHVFLMGNDLVVFYSPKISIHVFFQKSFRLLICWGGGRIF